ncbi:FAD binding domain-containing protein [Toxoplasma gondii RUB]|uniref:FAD binding domain-containing protein n=1 Tax=Toxoplasma gondii RUB TaxID=935652 RepID=A0A086M4L0_TOXGO|nr:FAD binding domain-containing protein [Toxoplasma gondii RUB]
MAPFLAGRRHGATAFLFGAFRSRSVRSIEWVHQFDRVHPLETPPATAVGQTEKNEWSHRPLTTLKSCLPSPPPIFRIRAPASTRTCGRRVAEPTIRSPGAFGPHCWKSAQSISFHAGDFSTHGGCARRLCTNAAPQGSDGCAIASQRDGGQYLYVPVLIVGAGPIGLSLALLLRRMRVPFLVVERDEEARCQPKAHYCSSRSMEVWRMLGHLDEAMENEVPSLDVWKHFSYCTHLVGSSNHPRPNIAARDHFSNAYTFKLPDGRTRYFESESPCRVMHLPQHILLPLLYARLHSGARQESEDCLGTWSALPAPSLALTSLSTRNKLAETECMRREEPFDFGNRSSVAHKHSPDSSSPEQSPRAFSPDSPEILFRTKWLSATTVEKKGDRFSRPAAQTQSLPDPRPASFVRSKLLSRALAGTNAPQEIQVDSAFVVACDGANSGVATQLPGYHREGVDCLQRLVNITFISRHLAALIQSHEVLRTQDDTPSRSPRSTVISSATPPPSMLYYVMNADVIGVVVLHSLSRGEFVAHIPFFAPHERAREDFPVSVCEEIVHRLAGLRLRDVRIVEARGWTMAAKVSNSFLGSFPLDGASPNSGQNLSEERGRHCESLSFAAREGGTEQKGKEETKANLSLHRILLAGDAAHQLPPAGGLGMNLGMGDVVGLAWRLGQLYARRNAAFFPQGESEEENLGKQGRKETRGTEREAEVERQHDIRGRKARADEETARRLLQSYDEERRLVAKYTCSVAVDNFSRGLNAPSELGLDWSTGQALSSCLDEAAQTVARFFSHARSAFVSLRSEEASGEQARLSPLLPPEAPQAPAAVAKRILQLALQTGRQQVMLCQRWLPQVWGKRVEAVKTILQDENRNLSLHYPGADLAYAYTASQLYRHSDAGRSHSGPAVMVSESPLAYRPTSWRGCRVPHAWLYAASPGGVYSERGSDGQTERKVFRLSTVDIPLLHDPPCAYSFLLFSQHHLPAVVSALRAHHRGLQRQSSFRSSSSSPSSSSSRGGGSLSCTESGCFAQAFCVCWESAGDRDSLFESAECVRLDRRPLVLDGARLSRLGRLSLASLVGEEREENGELKRQETNESNPRDTTAVRWLWSADSTREKFLELLREARVKDGAEQISVENLLLVLRPDGHILEVRHLQPTAKAGVETAVETPQGSSAAEKHNTPTNTREKLEETTQHQTVEAVVNDILQRLA